MIFVAGATGLESVTLPCEGSALPENQMKSSLFRVRLPRFSSFVLAFHGPILGAVLRENTATAWRK
jgi:hypothetical protein